MKDILDALKRWMYTEATENPWPVFLAGMFMGVVIASLAWGIALQYFHS
jgi:hypothetical protein